MSPTPAVPSAPVEWSLLPAWDWLIGRHSTVGAVTMSEGDQHPFLLITVQWPQGGTQHVLALLDTRAEVTILHSPFQDLQGWTVLVQGLGGMETAA